VVSVLATEPKGRGFKSGRGGGYLMAIKICSTPSFGCEVKLDIPRRKISRHVKDPFEVFQILLGKILTPSSIPPTCLRYLLVGLPESSGGRVTSYPHHHHGSYITKGMNNRPVGGRSSETVSLHHNQSINRGSCQILDILIVTLQTRLVLRLIANAVIYL
jgi:hypothetical protein